MKEKFADAKRKSNTGKRLLTMLCQFAPTPSNPLFNAVRIVTKMVGARKKGVRLIVFGESVLQGYSIFDELKNPDFYRRSNEAIDIVKYAADRLKIGVIFGFYKQNARQSKKWANNSLLCYIPSGIKTLEALEYCQDKILIPFEKEFTENLYVEEGSIENLKLVKLGNLKVGFNICQDSWQELSQVRQYKSSPLRQVLDQEPDILINLSCSPFFQGKTDEIINNVLSRISRENEIPVIYLGSVGLDSIQLILAGHSLLVYKGEIYKHMKLFEEDEIIIDLNQLHNLFQTKKPKNMHITAANKYKRHLRNMLGAFRSVFYHLCLKHAIIAQEIDLPEKIYGSCFKDLPSIHEYLETIKKYVEQHAKKGFAFCFDGSPKAVLLAHVLSVSLPNSANLFVLVSKNSEVAEDHRRFLDDCGFKVIESKRTDFMKDLEQLMLGEQLVGLDTFCFTDYMLGEIPNQSLGLAPLGSLSLSLIYDLLQAQGLMKFSSLSRQAIDDQLVMDLTLQSFLRHGKDFTSIMLKCFPEYYEYMSRYGQVSNIATSFLEYLLSIYKQYHEAMNYASNRINPASIIQLTWYSPNRYRYLNHSYGADDWHIRAAFEKLRMQLENW